MTEDQIEHHMSVLAAIKDQRKSNMKEGITVFIMMIILAVVCIGHPIAWLWIGIALARALMLGIVYYDQTNEIIEHEHAIKKLKRKI